ASPTRSPMVLFRFGPGTGVLFTPLSVSSTSAAVLRRGGVVMSAVSSDGGAALDEVPAVADRVLPCAAALPAWLSPLLPEEVSADVEAASDTSGGPRRTSIVIRVESSAPLLNMTQLPAGSSNASSSPASSGSTHARTADTSRLYVA